MDPVTHTTQPIDVPASAPPGADKNAVPPNLPGQEAAASPAAPPQAPRAASEPDAAPASEPKKYIRTFASDMEVVKQGGTPDLAPYTPRAAPPLPQAAPQASGSSQSAQPVARPAPAFRPAPLPAQPRSTEHLNILVHPPETPHGISFPSPTPEPVVESGPAAPREPAPASRPAPEVKAPRPQPVPPRPAPLQTYESDFSDRVKETQASRATVLAAEQDARRGPVRSSPEPKKGNKAAIAVGTVLILLGAAGAYYAYAQYLRKTAPVFTEPVVTAPIFVNESRVVAGTGPTLMRAFTESLSRPPAQGAVRELTLATTTTNVFLGLLLPAPDVLLRNLGASPSTSGIVHAGGTASVFFILPALSYSDTFAGMLLWEPTMLRDLGVLYPAIPAAPAATTTATSTARMASTTPRHIPGFVDEVVQNHDVRVYRDEGGAARVLYGYWNQRTLVIARDPEAFTELVNRLRNSRTR